MTFKCPVKSLKERPARSAQAGKLLRIVCGTMEAPEFFLPGQVLGVRQDARGSPPSLACTFPSHCPCSSKTTRLLPLVP